MHVLLYDLMQIHTFQDLKLLGIHADPDGSVCSSAGDSQHFHANVTSGHCMINTF